MQYTKCEWNDGYIDIHFANGFTYDVKRTSDSLEQWLTHMAAKNWWSKLIEEDFTRIWNNHG